MNILVVYYSRANATRRIAQKLAEKLDADIEEVLDLSNQAGAAGYIRTGGDTLMKRPTQIASVQKDPQNYDLTIIGTPVWGETMTPAIRNYLTYHGKNIRQAAVFAVQGELKRQLVFDDMRRFVKNKPIAELILTVEEATTDGYREKLNDFMKRILAFLKLKHDPRIKSLKNIQ